MSILCNPSLPEKRNTSHSSQPSSIEQQHFHHHSQNNRRTTDDDSIRNQSNTSKCAVLSPKFEYKNHKSENSEFEYTTDNYSNSNTSVVDFSSQEWNNLDVSSNDTNVTEPNIENQKGHLLTYSKKISQYSPDNNPNHNKTDIGHMNQITPTGMGSESRVTKMNTTKKQNYYQKYDVMKKPFASSQYGILDQYRLKNRGQSIARVRKFNQQHSKSAKPDYPSAAYSSRNFGSSQENIRRQNCFVCHEQLVDFKANQHHSEEHSMPEKCMVCSKHLNVNSNLRRHFLGHLQKFVYLCPYCSTSYSRKDNLTTHLLQKHNLKSWQRKYAMQLAKSACKTAASSSLSTSSGSLSVVNESLDTAVDYITCTTEAGEQNDQKLKIKQTDVLMTTSEQRLKEYTEADEDQYNTQNDSLKPPEKTDIQTSKQSDSDQSSKKILNYTCNKCGVLFAEVKAMKHHVLLYHSEQCNDTKFGTLKSNSREIANSETADHLPLRHTHHTTNKDDFDDQNNIKSEEIHDEENIIDESHCTLIDDIPAASETEDDENNLQVTISSVEQENPKEDEVSMYIYPTSVSGQSKDFKIPMTVTDESAHSKDFDLYGIQEEEDEGMMDIECLGEYSSGMLQNNDIGNNSRNSFGQEIPSGMLQNNDTGNNSRNSFGQENDKWLQSTSSDIMYSTTVAKGGNTLSSCEYGIKKITKKRLRTQGDLLCNFCGIKLSSWEEIIDHKNVHDHVLEEGSKNTCVICFSVLSNKDCLRRHAMNHMGIRFQCPYCNNAYTRSDNLRKHVREYHGSNDSLL